MDNTPPKKQRRTCHSPPNSDGYQWLAGAVRILQKDVCSILSTIVDMSMRIKSLESNEELQPTLQLPPFQPSVGFDTFSKRLDKLALRVSSLEDKFCDIDSSKLGSDESALPQPDQTNLKGAVRSHELAASAFETKKCADEKSLEQINVKGAVRSHELAASDFEIGALLEEKSPAVQTDVGDAVRSHELAASSFEMPAPVGVEVPKVPTDAVTRASEVGISSSSSLCDSVEEDDSDVDDDDSLDICKFNATAEILQANLEQNDKMTALRRIDSKHGGSQNIVKVENLPPDYNSIVLEFLFKHEGLWDAIHFVHVPETAFDRDGHRVAFIKLASHSAAKKFLETFEGYDAWSEIAHTVLRATEASWQELD